MVRYEESLSFSLEEERLLIVSRARHVFGTGPGIIQQGTAAYMHRAELLGTFTNVSWGHQLLAWFLAVMSSAFSRPVCSKLCKIGNGFEVPLLKAGKFMLLESWQLDVKPLNYKCCLVQTQCRTAFLLQDVVKRHLFCDLSTTTCAAGSYCWTLSRMKCPRLTCLLCLRPGELISDITMWKESRQVALGGRKLYVSS